MKRLITYVLLSAYATLGIASEPSKLSNDKYSQVVIEKVKNKGDIKFNFKVKIAEGIKYNWDGPWKFKFKGEGVTEKTMGTSDFDKTLGGYAVTVPADSKSLEYRLTAFVCTKDKTRCFREVHKETITL